MILPKSAYQFLGIPTFFHGLSYKDTKLVPTKQIAMEASILRAPTNGTLLVSGCSAPIVNQMIEAGKKVVGISFPELFDARFSDDTQGYPGGDIVLLYGIGSEPAVKKEFSSAILQSVMSYYKARDSLLILETPLTSANFQTTYGIAIKNTVVLTLQEEDAWIA